LESKLSFIYKCNTKTIPYVITWDGVVTKYYKRYIKELEVTNQIEAYIQTLGLRKTFELISLERRRGIEENLREVKITESILKLCERENRQVATENYI
jgi:hypothetical protein